MGIRIEDQMTETIIKWVRAHAVIYPELELFHHIPNEGKRKPWISKRMGILAGIPDFHLPIARYGYLGFWLELKAPRKKPTKQQTKILKLLTDYGNCAKWADSVETAIELIMWYIRGKVCK